MSKRIPTVPLSCARSLSHTHKRTQVESLEGPPESHEVTAAQAIPYILPPAVRFFFSDVSNVPPMTHRCSVSPVRSSRVKQRARVQACVRTCERTRRTGVRALPCQWQHPALTRLSPCLTTSLNRSRHGLLRAHHFSPLAGPRNGSHRGIHAAGVDTSDRVLLRYRRRRGLWRRVT